MLAAARELRPTSNLVRNLLWLVALLGLVFLASRAWISLQELTGEFGSVPQNYHQVVETDQFALNYYRFVDHLAGSPANLVAPALEKLATHADFLNNHGSDHRLSELARELNALLQHHHQFLHQLSSDQGPTVSELRVDFAGFEQRLTELLNDRNQIRVEALANTRELAINSAEKSNVIAVTFGGLVALVLVLLWREVKIFDGVSSPDPRLEAQRDHYANHDSLTGLANRAVLSRRLQAALDLSREQHSHVFMLTLDLDGFKEINDTYGHASGDIILEIVARRLCGLVRTHDIVARLGGDEFALIMGDCPNRDIAEKVARRIMDSFEHPVSVGQQSIPISTSVGIASSKEGELDADQMMRNADVALNDAKSAGRRRYSFYKATMATRLQRRHELSEELRVGLADNSFSLVFQPIFDVRSLEIVGAEVLVRWTSQKMGPISPVEFIPLAEDNGLMPDLGAWIMSHAVASAERWPAAFADLRLSINLSPAQLTHHDFIQTVDTIFSNSTIRPERVTFEITEGVLMHDLETARTILKALRQRGFKIALDDFGTGYSSLAYLKEFPIDFLKIDRRFVNDLDSEGGDRGIVRTIIGLAHNLEMNVVAEGIETLEQLQQLVGERCEFGQGFYYSPPLKEGEFKAFVEQNQNDNDEQMEAIA